MGQVAGDRPLAEEQRGGNLPVGLPLGNQGGDAALGGRQAQLARAPTDASELIACLLDPGRSPKLLEAAERLVDRVASGALQPCAPTDDAERK